MQEVAARGDRTGLGIVIILASVLTMAFADALVKLVSADRTVWQVLAARALFAIPILVMLAPPPVITTFDYAYPVSAALWGFVFFAETPDLLTLGGMVLITLAGLLVATPSKSNAA